MEREHLHAVLHEVEVYSAEIGTTPDRLLRTATGNPRLYARLQAHAKRIDAEIAKVRSYLNDRIAEDMLR